MLIWHNQGIGDKLPEVLYLDSKIIFLIEGLHDLVPAIMTWCNNQLCSGLGNLSGLDTTIKHTLVGIRHCPGTTPGTTTVGTITVWVQFPYIIAAGFGHRPPFLEIRLPKSFKGFTAIVAWIVIGNCHLMYRLINLNFPLLKILKQQIEDSDYLEFFECFWVPSVQPGPGCKVSMSSLWEEENLTVQPPHVINEASDNRFHRLIIPGKKPPVHTFPIF